MSTQMLSLGRQKQGHCSPDIKQSVRQNAPHSLWALASCPLCPASPEPSSWVCLSHLMWGCGGSREEGQVWGSSQGCPVPGELQGERWHPQGALSRHGSQGAWGLLCQPGHSCILW